MYRNAACGILYDSELSYIKQQRADVWLRALLFYTYIISFKFKFFFTLVERHLKIQLGVRERIKH